MTARPLEARVRRSTGISVIDLDGEISGLSEETLDAILLNFSGVGYINSTGIALIVGLLAKAQVSGARLIASGLSDHFEQIFQITRLADFITIFADEEAAVAETQTRER